MPKNRILATIAIVALVLPWAWAQSGTPDPAAATAPAASPTPPGELAEAEKVLDAAIAKVSALRAVSANILQSVTMLGQRFEVKGRYLKAPKNRVYLLLEVFGLPDARGKMLQVCDGETLWDYQQVFETKIYHKFQKVDQILDKLKSPELDAAVRDQVVTQLGLAGPEVLLVGLRKAIKFDQRDAGTLDGRPVDIIRGTWLRPEGLAGPNLTPQQQLAPLPSFVPSLVTVYLGHEDGWPYKVVLVGRQPSILMEDTRPIGPDGRRLGSIKLIQKPLVTRMELIYSDVTLNPSLKDTDFAFQAPTGVRVEDGTEAVLDNLEKAIQSKIAQKKAEGAGAEGAGAEPLLNQAIDVPKAKSEPSGAEPH